MSTNFNDFSRLTNLQAYVLVHSASTTLDPDSSQLAASLLVFPPKPEVQQQPGTNIMWLQPKAR